MNEIIQAPWRIETWFSDLKPEVTVLLKTYFDELIKFNRTVNLISIKTLPVADLIHMSDSILACRMIFQAHPQLSEIYDIGSGNGFPGIVFAILYPQVTVKLLDSDQRKCEFLKHIASLLRLSNVSVLNQTFESLPDASIRVAICRGFASISKTILLARKPFVKGGAIYHLKGDSWSAEVGEIPTQLCSVWTPSLVGEYKLPVGSVKFGIVKTEKIGA